MAAMQVFVSHAHADNELCDRYVTALRARGLDVWYDRTNLQAGHSLSSDIEAELRRRTAFVVMATPASLASQWVKSEIAAFRSLAAQDSTRLFLPVRATECEMPLLWADILWIDAVGLGFEAAVDEMAVALGAPGAKPAPNRTPQPNESVDDLVKKGKSLIYQKKNAEAISFLERATQLDPRHAYAWKWLGNAYYIAGRFSDALAAYDRALALDYNNGIFWSDKGHALMKLQRYEEALMAYDHSLVDSPNSFVIWQYKGQALRGLGRTREAEEAEEQATKRSGWLFQS